MVSKSPHSGKARWKRLTLPPIPFPRMVNQTDIKNRLMGMGTGEERVRCVERVTWKLILPYVMAQEMSLGNSNRVSVSI